MDRLSALFHYLEELRKLEEISPMYSDTISRVIHEIELELEIQRLQ
ncbi:hypothetical protein J1P26_07405 [Neobacillus sp. MM2021_6]|nr:MULTISPECIES: hypothetical protein [Bacillaceae]MBO0959559.1 hypothetical protein [Neobacillus sp. MM2021_6]NHC17143.1 hypothetical protein [Bacillus sp. MM2020_4]